MCEGGVSSVKSSLPLNAHLLTQSAIWLLAELVIGSAVGNKLITSESRNQRLYVSRR